MFDVERLESDAAATADDDLDFIREIPVAEVWLSLSTIFLLFIDIGNESLPKNTQMAR